MNMKPLSAIICTLLLASCSKSSSIDGRKTGATTPRMDGIPAVTTQLTDRDVFGDELTLDITEEDIENAVEAASEGFEIPLKSSVILVESGSRAPDVIMQKEMQRYYQVSIFSGIPVARKKRAVQLVTPVKETVSDTENFSDNKSGIINANYMQALRYIGAKGRQKTIVVYWSELEAGKYNAATKEVVWKKYTGGNVSGSSLRYLIRFALVDVATGEWATYSPVNTELMAVALSGETGNKKDMTEQQLVDLKKKTCKMVVEDLVNRYSNKI
ncbi:hypothetical protein [Superficieibacter sp. HKU1]|uniref:hypothetical protein n=1 Tax=Superficieibacter sp. HKU1 TaxID=3031919 RepID=UPI0023E322D0|nr:hypothetical protein [Superficieibacter sp. HKU1]WES67603.1 hypothetical protein P0H77_18615 [Superficieibacter sp. HKU1]